MQTLKLIFDTFGSTVFVPAMLFVISLCMRVSVKKAFSSALSEAKSLLGTPCSFSEIADARSALQSAHDSLTVGEKKNVTLKFKFTPGRIITVVLCGAAFTVGTLYLISKKKEN